MKNLRRVTACMLNVAFAFSLTVSGVERPDANSLRRSLAVPSSAPASRVPPTALIPSTIYTATPNVSIADDAYNGTLASMACSTINTTPTLPTGVVVANVSVIANITHTWIGDLTIKLRSPSGTVFTVLNRPGSTRRMTERTHP